MVGATSINLIDLDIFLRFKRFENSMEGNEGVLRFRPRPPPVCSLLDRFQRGPSGPPSSRAEVLFDLKLDFHLWRYHQHSKLPLKSDWTPPWNCIAEIGLVESEAEGHPYKLVLNKWR
jgi:hypothetical protein